MISELVSYSATKDSTIEWMGDIPQHWEIRRVKRLARPGHKTFVDGDWIESPYIVPDGIRLIQTGNVGVGRYREKGFRYIAEETFDSFGCTEFEPGDVLICRLGEPVARACLAPDLGKRMITSVDVCMLKLDGAAVSAAYVVFSMSSHAYLDWVNSLVRGSTRDRVSRSMLGSFSMPFPPFPEQTAIARFLDHMDRRTQAYISAKENLIALLDEYKKALIHQAVTGQIDVRTGRPYGEYKESGVEWLGATPTSWAVGPLKRFVLRRRGAIKAGPFGSQLTADEMMGTDIKVYTQRNVIDRNLAKGINYISSEKFEKLRSFEVLPGDVLVTSRGTIGRTMLVTGGCERGILHPCLIRAQPDPSLILAEFLMMIIQDSQLLPQQLVFLSNATTIEVIYSDTLANVVVPVPPLPEQNAIVDFLTHATDRIDTVVATTREQIDSIGEYRTRLTADVVTGKLDVREAAANLPNMNPIDEVSAGD